MRSFYFFAKPLTPQQIQNLFTFLYRSLKETTSVNIATTDNKGFRTISLQNFRFKKNPQSDCDYRLLDETPEQSDPTGLARTLFQYRIVDGKPTFIISLSREDYYKFIKNMPDCEEKQYLLALPLRLFNGAITPEEKAAEDFSKISYHGEHKKELSPQSSQQTAPEYCLANIENNQGLMFLHDHADTSSYTSLAKLFHELNKRGVNNLYLEFPRGLSSFVFDEFNQTGNTSLFRQHFTLCEFTSVDPKDICNLVTAAFKAGIKIFPVDRALRHHPSEMNYDSMVKNRNSHIANNIRHFQNTKNGKFIVLLGASHYEVAQQLNIPACLLLDPQDANLLKTERIIQSPCNPNDLITAEKNKIIDKALAPAEQLLEKKFDGTHTIIDFVFICKPEQFQGTVFVFRNPLSNQMAEKIFIFLHKNIPRNIDVTVAIDGTKPTKIFLSRLELIVSASNDYFIAETSVQNNYKVLFSYGMANNKPHFCNYLRKSDFYTFLRQMPDSEEKSFLFSLPLAVPGGALEAEEEEAKNFASAKYPREHEKLLPQANPQSASELCLALIDLNQGLTFLHTHDDEASFRTLADLLPKLREKCVECLYLEFSRSEAQYLFEEFNRTGNSDLIKRFIDHFPVIAANHCKFYCDLAVAAYQNNIKIIPIDRTNFLKTNSSEYKTLVHERNLSMQENFRHLHHDKNGKFIILLGAGHYSVAAQLNTPCCFLINLHLLNRFKDLNVVQRQYKDGDVVTDEKQQIISIHSSLWKKLHNEASFDDVTSIDYILVSDKGDMSPKRLAAFNDLGKSKNTYSCSRYGFLTVAAAAIAIGSVYIIPPLIQTISPKP